MTLTPVIDIDRKRGSITFCCRTGTVRRPTQLLLSPTDPQAHDENDETLQNRGNHCNRHFGTGFVAYDMNWCLTRFFVQAVVHAPTIINVVAKTFLWDANVEVAYHALITFRIRSVAI